MIANDVSGNAGTTISLNDIISASATDSTETFTLSVSGIPDGAILADGNNNNFTGDGSSVIDITDWDLSTLEITPAEGMSGTFTLTVSATSIESNDDTASDSDTILVTVNPVASGTPIVINAVTYEDTTTSTESGLSVVFNSADGSDISHFKVTSISHGSLYYIDGESTVSVSAGDFVSYEFGDALHFTPSSDFSGTASFSVQSSVGSSDDGLGGNIATAYINVIPVADTPTLSFTSPTFEINENTSLSLADIITVGATDSSEIAFLASVELPTPGTVLADDSGNYFVSTLAGSTVNLSVGGWDVDTLSITPPYNFTGDLTVGFTAASLDGSDTAEESGDITISVANVPQAPNLIDLPYTLSTISEVTSFGEDSSYNYGDFVSNLTTGITNYDGSESGIAITEVDNTNGQWQYSTDFGSTWQNIENVSENNALLLRGTDQIRFLPNGDFTGVADINFKAWDRTSGVAGNTINTIDNIAFSNNQATASITVSNTTSGYVADDYFVDNSQHYNDNFTDVNFDSGNQDYFFDFSNAINGNFGEFSDFGPNPDGDFSGDAFKLGSSFGGDFVNFGAANDTNAVDYMMHYDIAAGNMMHSSFGPDPSFAPTFDMMGPATYGPMPGDFGGFTTGGNFGSLDSHMSSMDSFNHMPGNDFSGQMSSFGPSGPTDMNGAGPMGATGEMNPMGRDASSVDAMAGSEAQQASDLSNAGTSFDAGNIDSMAGGAEAGSAGVDPDAVNANEDGGEIPVNNLGQQPQQAADEENDQPTQEGEENAESEGENQPAENAANNQSAATPEAQAGSEAARNKNDPNNVLKSSKDIEKDFS